MKEKQKFTLCSFHDIQYTLPADSLTLKHHSGKPGEGEEHMKAITMNKMNPSGLECHGNAAHQSNWSVIREEEGGGELSRTTHPCGALWLLNVVLRE